MEGSSSSVCHQSEGNQHTRVFGVVVHQCVLAAQTEKPSFHLVLSNKDMCDAKGKYYSVYLTYSLCQLIVCIKKKYL